MIIMQLVESETIDWTDDYSAIWISLYITIHYLPTVHIPSTNDAMIIRRGYQTITKYALAVPWKHITAWVRGPAVRPSVFPSIREESGTCVLCSSCRSLHHLGVLGKVPLLRLGSSLCTVGIACEYVVGCTSLSPSLSTNGVSLVKASSFHFLPSFFVLTRQLVLQLLRIKGPQ